MLLIGLSQPLHIVLLRCLNPYILLPRLRKPASIARSHARPIWSLFAYRRRNVAPQARPDRSDTHTLEAVA